MTLPEVILVAQIGERWVASLDGVMLDFQRDRSAVIGHSVATASQMAGRGATVEVIVQNGRERYTVWNSAVDGYVSGTVVPSGSSAQGTRAHQSM